jgi:hypothetical protein
MEADMNTFELILIIVTVIGSLGLVLPSAQLPVHTDPTHHQQKQ